MKRRNGSALVVLSIILAIVIIGVIIWFTLEKSSFNNATPTTAASSTTQTSSALASSSGSSSVLAQPITWKTYQNADYHFSIQYPSNWVIIEAATDTTGNVAGFGLSLGLPGAQNEADDSYSDFAGGVEVYQISATETIPEAYENITALNLTGLATTSIEIGSSSAIEYLSIPGDINYNEAFIIHGGELYGIYQLSPSLDDNATFKKFAGSLSFTN